MTSSATPVWCSDVIEMVSEYRAFVRHGEIVGVQYYDGEPGETPASNGVQGILDELRGSLPAGCALDVAVGWDGRVVLVEANDGFSLGRYGFDSGLYVDLLHARWTELVRPSF